MSKTKMPTDTGLAGGRSGVHNAGKMPAHHILVWIFSLLSCIALGADLPAPDVADVSYGPDSRNTFDLWLAKSSKKTPVVLYYHGGAFKAGDKRDISPHLVKGLLDCGISVVSANYRFLSPSTPYPASHEDAVLALQFLKSKAEEFNIDSSRIGLSGTSAGADMALWIGLHDDMADKENQDPIKRHSTRVNCVMAYDGQTSIDPDWFMKNIGSWIDMHKTFAEFYGVSTEEMRSPSPELTRKINDASALNLASVDDPAVFLSYKSQMTDVPLPPGTRWEIVVHHPMLGVFLSDKLNSLKVESYVYWADGASKNNPSTPSTDTDFLCKKLNQP